MAMPDAKVVIEWLATNVGPAIPFIFSGGFSVWALVLKMRSDAAARADAAARDAREESRRKQEKSEREADALRIENERVKTAAYERAERLLSEERQRSAKLLDDRLSEVNTMLKASEDEVDRLNERLERYQQRCRELELELQRYRGSP